MHIYIRSLSCASTHTHTQNIYNAFLSVTYMYLQGARRDSFIRATWLMYMCDMARLYVWQDSFIGYGVATISRLLKIIGLFGRISSLLYGSFAKETHNFKEPTNRSHPTTLRTLHVGWQCVWVCVTWLVRTCDMTRIYMWHDSCTGKHLVRTL